MLLICLLGGILGGCDGPGMASEDESVDSAAVAVSTVANLPPGVSAEAAEEGRELFLPCAVCHGLDGRGNQLGPSLRDSEWRRISGSLEEIEAVIRSGIPAPSTYPIPMVPMGGGDFDDEELRAVASYVYAISRGKPAPAQ
jgi:mono/diheme cytochrome c family protein